jgi:beta-fructofuranosidase
MNFVPDQTQLQLWDTWVFISEEDEVHLFYLANKPGGAWGYAGHAVSTDWLRWRDLPEIQLRGEEGSWDAGGSGTGMVFRYEDGRYYMTYTGALSVNEASGLLVSDDLILWEKLTPDGPLWSRQNAAPYETDENRVALSAAWRDAYVTRNPQGEWEAVCSARVDAGPAAGRACLARCRLEGLEQWVTLPPLAHTGRYSSMEVPEIFKFEGRYWVLFSTGSGWGVRLDTPTRSATIGTYFLSSKTWAGPYDAPAENLLIGAGRNQMHSYVGRVVVHNGQHLVYHHYASNPTAMGLPKRLVAEGDRLALAPWDGLSGLWQHQVMPKDWAAYTFGNAQAGRWNLGHEVVKGVCEYGSDVLLADVNAPEIDVDAMVHIRSGRRAGIGVSVTPDRKSSGLVCLLDADAGEITLSGMERWEHACGLRLDARIDTVKFPVQRNRPYRLRILRRSRFLELFVEGRLIFSSVVPDLPAGGALACVLESADAAFLIDRAHALEPMAR